LIVYCHAAVLDLPRLVSLASDSLQLEEFFPEDSLIGTQPTKINAIDIFHVPFTRNLSKCWIAESEAERGYCSLVAMPIKIWVNMQTANQA
jgi:hypothetical protein